MTTANDIDRGGRPRVFDEDELIARITDDRDFLLIEAALIEHSSHPTWAQGCVTWLWRKRAGTARIGTATTSRYRRMLAEIPFDPLKPPGGRRRALREFSSQSGTAAFLLIAGGAIAGAVALALHGHADGSRALLALAASDADNARTLDSEALSPESGAPERHLRLVSSSEARECVPGARSRPQRTRVGCASVAA